MPRKRGKGNKLARMSDEERIRYLQHRAEIELEAKRRKQQLIAVFTKNKLKREEGFSRLNTAKINEQWRYILRQMKCEELIKDVEYLWRNFDKSIKAKDDIIRRFYTELEIADKDHRRLQVAHMEMIDKLIDQHKQKLLCLHDFYMEELNNIKSTDIVDLDRLKSGMEKSSKEMSGIITRKGELWTGKVSARKTQCFVNIHNIIYIKNDMTSELVQNTSDELEILWKQLNEVLCTYEMTSKAKRKQYEYLKEQDDAHKARTAEFPEIHMQLQDTIDCLSRNIDDLSTKGERRVSQLKLTTKQIKERRDRIKEQLSIAQTIQSARLKKLSVSSTNTLKHLEKLSDKGGTITQFIKTCSKIEPLIIDTRHYTLENPECEPSRSSESRFLEVFDKLGNFFDQFNHIKADNVLLKKELSELLEENRKLKQILRTYLIDISGGLVTHPIKRELNDSGVIRCH